jgi:hypothetical protein
MKITTIIHGVMQIIHQTLKAKNHCQGTYLSKDIIWVSYGREKKTLAFMHDMTT